MKKKLVAILIAFVITVSLAACGAGEETTLTGIVVSVNGTVISLMEMDSSNMGGRNGCVILKVQNRHHQTSPLPNCTQNCQNSKFKVKSISSLVVKFLNFLASCMQNDIVTPKR